MSITSDFDPVRDGWSFRNFGSPDLPWELFQQTYLGIDKNAELDKAFYDNIYRNCAKPGNCGGMSLLARAVHKYGGYAGFCGPASFYTGGATGPDRDDLRHAINLFHGRQFSAPFVQQFLDLVNSGDLGNAEAAYNKIQAQRGSGDYALLVIATDKVGGAAHTIIPYALDPHPAGEPAGTKYIYVWDSVFPCTTDLEYYTSGSNRLVIRKGNQWEYRQGFLNGIQRERGTLYEGGSGAWCFAYPMSLVLHKAPHPMSVGIAITGLVKILLTGTGCAVSQIEDDSGHRYYTADTDGHQLRAEIETDSAHRLPDAVRWPWFDQADDAEPPGELYFLRRPLDRSQLRITMHGTHYRVTYAQGTDLVEVSASGAGRRSRDVLTVQGIGTPDSAVRIATDHGERRFDIEHRRVSRSGTAWRGIELSGAHVGDNDLVIRSAADMQAFEVAGEQRAETCTVQLKRYAGGELALRPLGVLSVNAGEAARLTLRDWSALDRTDVLTETVSTLRSD